MRRRLLALFLSAIKHVTADGERCVLVTQSVALVVIEVQTHAPRGVQSVAATSAVAVAAHRRVAHHLLAHVAEARVVGVVCIHHQRVLVVATEISQHAFCLETVVDAAAVAPCTCCIAEVSASHLRFQLEVDHLLAFTVVDACEAALLGLHVHHLHRLEHVGGKVLRRGLDVRTEEFLSVHIDLRHRFALCGDASVGVHLYACQAFQQVLGGSIGFQLVTARIVFDGVLTNHHWGRSSRNDGLAQKAMFFLHKHVTQCKRLLPVMQRKRLQRFLKAHISKMHQHLLLCLSWLEQSVQSRGVKGEVAVMVSKSAHHESRVGEGQ